MVLSFSVPSESEYQEHFLRVKAAGAWGWQPHRLHVPNVMKSGSLNLLEPSGPHQACYGTPLPMVLSFILVTRHKIEYKERSNWFRYLFQRLWWKQKKIKWNFIAFP